MHQNYRLYIFDWDGTLMDSVPKIVHTVQNSAKLLELPIPTEEEVKGIIGLGLLDAFERLFGISDIETLNKLRDKYRNHYQEDSTIEMPLFDGSFELLSKLRENQKLMAVATGKGRKGLNGAMDMHDVSHFFHTSRTVDEAKSKPNPDMVLQILEELQVPPNEAIVIGDSEHDLKMAHAAGVDSVAVTFGAGKVHDLKNCEPKYIVDHHDELIALLFD